MKAGLWHWLSSHSRSPLCSLYWLPTITLNRSSLQVKLLVATALREAHKRLCWPVTYLAMAKKKTGTHGPPKPGDQNPQDSEWGQICCWGQMLPRNWESSNPLHGTHLELILYKMSNTLAEDMGLLIFSLIFSYDQILCGWRIK